MSKSDRGGIYGIVKDRKRPAAVAAVTTVVVPVVDHGLAAQQSGNYAVLDEANTFTAANTFSGKVAVTGTAIDNTPAAGEYVVRIGPETGAHVVMDGSQIAAKAGATTWADLTLQPFGGNATFGKMLLAHTMFRVQGEATGPHPGATGTGLEAFVSGGIATLYAYNRTSSAFIGLDIYSSGATFHSHVNAASGYGFRVAGTQVVGPQQTGWTAGTGAAWAGAFNADNSPTISAAYSQAEVQALRADVIEGRRRILALEQALRTHGLIN